MRAHWCCLARRGGETVAVPLIDAAAVLVWRRPGGVLGTAAASWRVLPSARPWAIRQRGARFCALADRRDRRTGVSRPSAGNVTPVGGRPVRAIWCICADTPDLRRRTLARGVVAGLAAGVRVRLGETASAYIAGVHVPGRNGPPAPLLPFCRRPHYRISGHIRADRR